MFICRRRNKVGRRYRFVRYMKLSNPTEVERQLDSLYISNEKLFVNLPRFHKEAAKVTPGKEPTKKKIGEDGGR